MIDIMVGGMCRSASFIERPINATVSLSLPLIGGNRINPDEEGNSNGKMKVIRNGNCEECDSSSRCG